MRRSLLAVALLLAAPRAAAPEVPAAAPSRFDPQALDLARWVDPFVGTGGHGHTFPGPTLPFGMVQLGPDTRLTGWDGCSGYHDDDSVVYGFSHTHLSGTGISDYGDVLFFPSIGEPKLISAYGKTAGEGYGSPFTKRNERAEAGYYAVHLDDSGIDVELTATERTGWHRYRFPKGETPYVLVDLAHRDRVVESSLEVVDGHTVRGMRRSTAWAKDQVVYFVAEFDRDFEATLAVDDALRPGSRTAAGDNVKAVLRFPDAGGKAVVARVGISAVDLDGAAANLASEAPGWDFDRVRAEARAAWNRELAAIVVEGGADEEKTTFYTALYHAFLQPNLFQDVDGRYRGMDRAIHRSEDGSTRYTVFSLWDTFRAAHPLYTLIQRARTRDFIATFLGMYREGGRLPVWELAGNETDTMIGYHAVPVIVDAWAKGIRDFDAALALEAMVASADADRFGLAAYREHGYIPADRESESVSKTLEYAYDDWTIARFAADLGRDDLRARFLARSQAWRNLVGPGGFLRPRAAGRWVEPFDPREVTFHYTEANAWQYTFFALHDVTAEISRLGGDAAFEAKLDELFATGGGTTGRDQADITGLLGQYAHGNEPSHHMAYLYAFAGAAAKTQERVHQLVATMYSPGPDGLAGNEDCGQMSAWYVLSALGFYPVTPGRAEYVIGTPLFDRATIRLESGREFRISAHRDAPGDFHVRAATLDGAQWTRSVLPHAALARGGELAFELGGEPTGWGSAPADRPRTEEAEVEVVPAPVASGPLFASGPVTIELRALEPAESIRYTLDGGEPTKASPRYEAPLAVTPPATVRFRAQLHDGWSPTVVAPVRRLDPDRRITLAHPPHRQYRGGSDQALLDGIVGSTDFRTGDWQGFYGVELEATIDLSKPTAIHRLATGFLHDQNSWIFLPYEVRYAVSDDGVDWTPLGSVEVTDDPQAEEPFRRELALEPGEPVTARWVRVETRSRQFCPPWHKGAGNLAFVFADEISID